MAIGVTNIQTKHILVAKTYLHARNVSRSLLGHQACNQSVQTKDLEARTDRNGDEDFLSESVHGKWIGITNVANRTIRGVETRHFQALWMETMKS